MVQLLSGEMQGGFHSVFHWLLEVSVARPLGTVSGTPYPGPAPWEPTLLFQESSCQAHLVSIIVILFPDVCAPTLGMQSR